MDDKWPHPLRTLVRRLEADLAEARAQIAVLTKAQVEAVDMASEAHRQAVEARAQIAAKDAALRGIWDWWYGEKRGKATPEEFASFLGRGEVMGNSPDEKDDIYLARVVALRTELAEARAQIAAKDAALRECLAWFDEPFESDLAKSDMEMAAVVRAALARETE